MRFSLMETNNLDLLMKRNNNDQEQQQHAEHLKCPRCLSSNTKFCYYNNYNKSQPRHFCKGCKRHWTKGGTLRNVPLDAGRKNKRQKLSKSVTNTNNISSVSSINHIATKGANDSLIFSNQEDNNIGTSNNLSGSNNLSQKPWQDSVASSFLDLSSLCDWSEINYLVSADLDVPWDEAELMF